MNKYILTENPSFSSIDRTGWIVEECLLKDNEGNKYRAVRDKMGVSWPFDSAGLREFKE